MVVRLMVAWLITVIATIAYSIPRIFLEQSALTEWVFVIFSLAVTIASSIYIWSLYIRRLHDMWRSGLLSLLFLVPLVNFVVFLWVLFSSSISGPNKYGEEPVGRYGFLV
ncbi:MAG: DUF805 domain-containing protein, partial [Candidatus Marinimicrobia bacterium]|nr:DUF805 domain-containing protein [Candidatus Neomarinimicrobiota bacterium]